MKIFNLRSRNGTGLAVLNLHVFQMPLIKFQLNSGHLGYQNGMILAILNFYVAPMPPIQFQLNPTYGLGGYVV